MNHRTVFGNMMYAVFLSSPKAKMEYIQIQSAPSKSNILRVYACITKYNGGWTPKKRSPANFACVIP